MFHGKPLIAWSIEVAKSSGLFDNVYISTTMKRLPVLPKNMGQ